MQYFETTFRNFTKAKVPIYENGKIMTWLEPKGIFTAESDSPMTSYAPYLTVTWEENGAIKLEQNPKWKPELLGPWVLRLDNIVGGPLQGLMVFSYTKAINVVRGIPRYIAVKLNDRLIWFSEGKYVQEDRKVEDKESGYYYTKSVKYWHWKKRPEAECVKIRDAMASKELDRMEKDMAIKAAREPKIGEDAV